MRLIVDELQAGTPLLQEMCFTDYQFRRNLVGVKPHLMMYNAPAGTFTFRILDDSMTEIVSKSFTSQDIRDHLQTTDRYAHVWHPILFDTDISLRNGTYYLELDSSGYTFSESAYMAWCREYESVYNDYKDGPPILDWEQPYGYYLFTRQPGMFVQ